MREIDRVLEIALYVEDMGRAVEFYRRVFRFAVLAKSAEPDRLTALDVGKTQVLLLSKKGASVEAVATPGGKTNELKDWKEWLAENDVVIESTVRWDRGGQSLYFRDPDGNLLELATPGVWPTY
jgi:catechol 2,3-dioxygenase-like lactoylglutathione lyase family enzyme